MKNDVKKTTFLVLIILTFLFLSLLIFNINNDSKENNVTSELEESDPLVSKALKDIDKLSQIINANIKNEDLSSLDIIKFAFANIEEKDFKTTKVKSKNISCTVGENISFYADTKYCNIKIISNDYIKNIEKSFFNQNIISTFPEIEYNNLYCKNDNKNYYCMGDYQENNLLTYKKFVTSYIEDEELIIYLYHLNIDLDDQNRCLKYFNEDYCKNYNNQEKPEINDDIIKKDGVNTPSFHKSL